MCFIVANFGRNRLRRSPSSSPNPFGGFHHHACMQACRFQATRSPAHSHCSIVQIQLVHNIPHTLFNVWAQRSHKLRNRFHTMHWDNPGPKFCNFETAAWFFNKRPAISSLCCRLQTCFETKFVGRVLLERLDTVSTRSCRSGQSSVDLAGCFGSSSVPASFLYSLTQTNGSLDPQAGQKRKSHTNSSYTHSSPQ